jgi:uncharacterized protein
MDKLNSFLSIVLCMSSIEIREYKRMDLTNAPLIEGFASTGLVGTIVANFLVAVLELDQIAAIDSPYFPPLSMVYAAKPKFPARVYAKEEPKVAVFLSEFTPPPTLHRDIAKAIFSWSVEKNCSPIITVVGVTEEKAVGIKDIAAVGSTDSARRMIENAGVELLKVGTIIGISGVLLNEGRWNHRDVIAFVVKIKEGIPDARAAAKTLEAIGAIVPSIRVDVAPLYEEAARLEAQVKLLRSQAEDLQKVMYR